MMNLLDLIYKALGDDKEEPRAYIGASSIGNPCERAIWYGLNFPDKKVIDVKTKLTFKIGKSLEDLVFNILSNKIKIIKPSYHFNCSDYPMFQGNVDAIYFDSNDVPQFFIEIKTAKNSSFNIFKNKGLRLWMPEYYDQVQSYMGMSDIHKCYVLAINKDASELHTELVEYDDERYQILVEKAKRIGNAKIEPPRINGSPSFWRCKMCFYKKICHK